MCTRDLASLLRSFVLFSVFILSTLAPVSSRATVITNPPKYKADNEKPEILKNVDINPQLGRKLDLDLAFQDESGADVKLGQYFDGKRPVVFVMSYFRCPHLCALVLNAVLDTLRGLLWSVGQEFQVVVVSIDPKEGPDLSIQKKENIVKAYGRLNSAPGWHFLTTTNAATLQTLSEQTGFVFQYDEKNKDYAHAAGFFVYTPTGVQSRVLYGVQYFTRDLKLALNEAAGGKIGTILDRIQLYCYQFDPNSRRYSVAAMGVMRLGGATTVLFIGIYMIVFWRSQRTPAKGLKAKEQSPS